MLLLPRVMALVVLLAALPQSQRAVLDRCDVTAEPVLARGLSSGLVEISGIAIGPGGVLLAHGDEYGILTALDTATFKPLREIHLRGTPRDDFEGIAVVGDTVALMTSSGRLYFTRLGTATSVPYNVIETGLGRTCELEGLGWHRTSGTLYLPCKRPRSKGGTKDLQIFRYHLGPPAAALPPIVVKGGAKNLRATAVEVDHATGHLLVLSADPAMLIEVDTTGRVLGSRVLPVRRHPQAEGLTLLPGAIVIADEGGGRLGRIAKYACE